MQTILMLYRVCANYTGCNMKKNLFSLFDTYPGYSKQKHVLIKTNRNLVHKTYDSQIKPGTVDSMLTW